MLEGVGVGGVEDEDGVTDELAEVLDGVALEDGVALVSPRPTT